MIDLDKYAIKVWAERVSFFIVGMLVAVVMTRGCGL